MTKIMQRIVARQVLTFVAGAILAVPAAHAQTDNGAEGGFYLGISGGLAQPVSKPVVSGALAAGATTIPFVGAVDYGSGWNARMTIGFSDNGRSDTGGDHDVSDFRVEVEYVALRLRRAGFTAGALSTKPGDNLNLNAGLANAQVRLVGKGPVRLWAGGGVGYARAKLPDARKGVACSCLSPMEGSGVTYQGKVTTDFQLSSNLQLFAEWAALRVPALRSINVIGSGVAYQPHWVGTANGGARIRF